MLYYIIRPSDSPVPLILSKAQLSNFLSLGFTWGISGFL